METSSTDIPYNQYNTYLPHVAEKEAALEVSLFLSGMIQQKFRKYYLEQINVELALYGFFQIRNCVLECIYSH